MLLQIALFWSFLWLSNKVKFLLQHSTLYLITLFFFFSGDYISPSGSSWLVTVDMEILLICLFLTETFRSGL